MSTTPGRFSSTAARAEHRLPIGVSRREGWAGITLAVVQAAGLAVSFQALNAPSGGVLLYASQLTVLAGIAIVASWASRHRGVHARGFTRALMASGGWAVLVAAVGGWFWIAHGPHLTNAVLTTLVAIAGLIPEAVVFGRLVKEGS